MKKNKISKLTDMQFFVTQENGTEPPFNNIYHDFFEKGIYVDIVSNEPLFCSLDKFDSGCGWPSFTQPIKENAIQYKKDVSFGMVRVEVMCNTCDGHLGHVFPDGPKPSRLRYCINSAAIKLKKERTHE